MSAALQPVHHSIRRLRGRRVPLGMVSVEIDHDQMEAMQRIALDIFTRSSNNGHGFTDALTWIYLSGLQHGTEASKEEEPKA